MAFRRYGGINFSATNNIIRNHYANCDNLTSSNHIGLNSDILTNGTTSNSNLVFESNIDMCGNSIFNATIKSSSLAGIFLIDSALQFYPIYSSLSNYSQYYKNSSSNVLPSNSTGTTGIYNNIDVSIANIDYAYLISPKYGLKVFSLPDFGGDVLLDVFNNTGSAVIVSPLVPLKGNSCTTT
jgi:hypothetical protein